MGISDEKLFIQFYLLLFVCFLVMSLLVGLVYKFTAETRGQTVAG